MHMHVPLACPASATSRRQNLPIVQKRFGLDWSVRRAGVQAGSRKRAHEVALDGCQLLPKGTWRTSQKSVPPNAVGIVGDANIVSSASRKIRRAAACEVVRHDSAAFEIG